MYANERHRAPRARGASIAFFAFFFASIAFFAFFFASIAFIRVLFRVHSVHVRTVVLNSIDGHATAGKGKDIIIMVGRSLI